MGILDKLTKSKDDSEDKSKSADKQSAQGSDTKEATVAELKQQSKGKQKKKQTAQASGQSDRAYRWIKEPVITEKATYLGAEGKYVFLVKPKANKLEIKKAVEELYGVNVTKVNIVRLPSKAITYGRISGRTQQRKKAIVTLKEGQSIEVYEGV